jgi:hypothetical protein
MRPAGILVLGVGVLATALGCCRHLQYTAGVCDCDPPPVESVLVPYTGRAQVQPAAVAPAKEPLSTPPKVIDPGKPPKVIDPGKPPKVVDDPDKPKGVDQPQ